MAARGEPKLTDEARAFVVHQLAMFDPPSVVAAAVRKEFGLEITPQSVEGYDPTKRAGARLSEKWKALFNETRKSFLDEAAGIAVSHRSVRMRALQRMAEKAELQGNAALAAQLLEQIAKEMGNAFTNRRELSGPGGKDLPAAPAAQVTVFALPDNGR